MKESGINELGLNLMLLINHLIIGVEEAEIKRQRLGTKVTVLICAFL